MTSTRERTRTGLIVATTAAVLVLVGAAAAGTPVGVITAFPDWTPGPGEVQYPTVAEPEAFGTPLPVPGAPGGSVAGAIVQALLTIVGVALIAAAALAVAVVILRTVRRVRDQRAPRLEAGDPARSSTRAAVRAAVADAHARIDVDDDANRVVIACWEQLEHAAAAAGAARSPSQTPTEYVVGVLRDLRLPAPPARRLAELYAAALFSGRPLGAREVADARGALRLLQDALDVPGDPS